MHDCDTARETAMEFLAEKDGSTPACVLGCPECEAWFAAAVSALEGVDLALEAFQPGDGYWEGYERQLSARLAAVSRKRGLRRVAWALGASAAAVIIALSVASVTTPPVREVSMAVQLSRHFEAVQMLLVAVKNTSDDFERERRQARRLLTRNRTLRQAAADSAELAAAAILDRIEPYLLDIQHLPAEDTRWLQARLRKDSILRLVSGYETIP